VRHLIAFLIVVTALSGCALPGSSSSGGKPTAGQTATYRDPHYHFTFRYPAAWSVPKSGGQKKSLGGTQTYELDITPDTGQANLQITVDQNLQDYSTIPEGKIANDPNGGPDTFHYHHLQVSSWPSIQIQRYSGSSVDEVDTITNTRQYSYDVRMLAGGSPFSASTTTGYYTIVRRLRLSSSI